jgi:hypothetical protein
VHAGTRRCALCGTFIRDGVVCPEHRAAEAANSHSPSLTHRTVEELPLEALSVPRTYQRELREHLVRRIVRDFDPDLLGLLVVVRDREGRLWILDGQHRWLVLVELGHRTALCEVLHDVPLARQARIFSGRNSSRIMPLPRDAFRANYVAKDPQVVAIVDILRRHGYQPPFGASRASASRFVCVGTLREVHAWGQLEPTATLLREAWPADELATQAPILMGLAAVLRLYPQLGACDLVKRLARHSADEVLRLARAEHANSRERRLWVHVAAVVVDLFNHGRTAAHRLDDPQIPYDAARQWKAGRR